MFSWSAATHVNLDVTAINAVVRREDRCLYEEDTLC